MATVRTIKRSKIEEVPARELLARAAGRPVLLDLGTGDGKFPYRVAKADGGIFCIGMDPSEESLREVSGKIGRKASRGGVDNLALVVCPLEGIPEEFAGAADRVTVNFPWGSLLRGVCAPEEGALKILTGLLKPGGALEMIFNMQVFEDGALRERLELPDFSEGYVDEVLAPAYAKHGVRITERALLAPGELPERTSWGGQLSLGSGRRSLRVSGVKE